MKIINKKRLIKTLAYRGSTIVLTQIVSWILGQNILINCIVLTTDVISTIWYYGYESIFEQIYRRIEKWIKK